MGALSKFIDSKSIAARLAIARNVFELEREISATNLELQVEFRAAQVAELCQRRKKARKKLEGARRALEKLPAKAGENKRAGPRPLQGREWAFKSGKYYQNLPHFRREGWLAVAGTNARLNESVWKECQTGDFCFHAANYHGSTVTLRALASFGPPPQWAVNACGTMALTYSQMSKKSKAKFGWVSKAEKGDVRRFPGMAPGSFRYVKSAQFKCLRGVDLLLIKNPNGCCFQLMPSDQSLADWSAGLSGISMARIRLSPAPECSKMDSIRRIIREFKSHHIETERTRKSYLKVEFDQLSKIHPAGYSQNGIHWLQI